MGDDDHGHAVIGQIPHNVQHFADQLGIECGGRLIKEQCLRLHSQGPGDGHTLLLTAREHVRSCLCLAGKSYLLKELHGFFFRFLLIHMLGQHRSQGHIVQHVLQGEEVESLEYHAHVFAEGPDIRILFAEVLSLVDHLAGGRGLQLVDAAKEGTLAGTGGSDDAHHFAFFYLYVDIF